MLNVADANDRPTATFRNVVSDGSFAVLFLDPACDLSFRMFHCRAFHVCSPADLLGKEDAQGTTVATSLPGSTNNRRNGTWLKRCATHLSTN
jgi:hypothetical protein